MRERRAEGKLAQDQGTKMGGEAHQQGKRSVSFAQAQPSGREEVASAAGTCNLRAAPTNRWVVQLGQLVQVG